MEYLLKSSSWETQDQVSAAYPMIAAAYSPGETTNLHGTVKHEYNGVTGVFIEVSIKTEDEFPDAEEHEKDFVIKTEEETADENNHGGVSDTKTEDKHSKVAATKKPKEIFQCDVCAKFFARRWNLKIHQRLHTGERPYACSSCDKSFKTKNEQRKHEIIHTRRDKPFKCEKCSRSFHSRFDLAEHDFAHTGISKHCCDQCGMYFSRRSALETHVIRIHVAPKGRTSSQWSCEKCGQRFTKKKNHEDHVNFHCYFKALEAVRAQKLALKKEAESNV